MSRRVGLRTISSPAYLEDSVSYCCLPVLDALSHGVPVIAFRRGAVGEFIQNGVNGFMVDKLDEFSEAVKKVDSISSATCVESSKPFMLENSILAYEKLILDVLEGREW